jgi:hypothetical protein
MHWRFVPTFQNTTALVLGIGHQEFASRHPYNFIPKEFSIAAGGPS